MNRERLHVTIDARLSSIAKNSPRTPAWYEPWHRLGPKSTWEERLLVCRAIRDSETFPADVGYFLMSWVIENLSVDAESRLDNCLQTMNRRESRRASDRIFANLMDEYGECEMAQRFRTDPQRHARRHEVGRQFFFGVGKPEVPEDSGWLKGFAEVVSFSLLTDRTTGKLGVRYRVDGGYWEITVYPLGMARESTAFVAGSGPWFPIPTWRVTTLPSSTGLGKPPPAEARKSALGGGFSPLPLRKTLG